MQLGPVAFVLIETILGKAKTKVTHHSVARDLGDHTRRRDRQAVAIAVDDGGLRKWKRKNRQTVDQDVLGSERERLQRRAHRLVTRAQNIDRVDLDRIDYPNGPDHFAVGEQFEINFLSQLGRELFGIV